MRPASLLVRLLCVVAPVACTSRDRDASPTPAGSGATQSTVRNVVIAKPPLTPIPPIPSATSTAAQASDRPMPLCGPDFHAWPVNRTGGPYSLSHCYAHAGGACLAPTDPALRRTLDQKFAQCVYDGPFAQKDPKSGADWCCYNLGHMGIGRPLTVASAPRSAELRPGPGWC